MNNDERRSFDNLILLCDEHHQIIDNKINEKKYTKSLIHEWKKKHLSVLNDDFTYDDKQVELLIAESKKYYKKIDSLDGPYKPIVSTNYIQRGIESELIQILLEKKVLLLTGVSFCGKSELAKQIAQYFFNKGYLFKRLLNTREASSFLESIGQNRICILEDPFGHTIQNEDRSELRLVKDLLNNIPDENLLILTSRKEVVHSVFNEANLSNCLIVGHKWYDLTTDDKDFLKSVWHQYSKNVAILDKNISRVIKIIESKRTIQAGQLDHLSKSEELKRENFTIDHLYKLAQIDINDICNDIIQKDSVTGLLLITIGLGANTKDGISIRDLDYIMQESLDYLTLEEKSFLDISKTLRRRESDEFKLPSYTDDYENIDTIQDELDFLLQRGYLVYVDGKYLFSHPHYIEISKSLIRKLGPVKKRKLLPRICNTLSCGDSSLAFNCSKQLESLFSNFDESLQKELFDIIYPVSNRSFFPKVADQCALFLTKNYKNQLISEYKSNIIFRLQSKSEEYDITFIDEEPVRWHQADYFDRSIGFNEKHYLELLSSLHRNKFLTAESIWRGLVSIRDLIVDVDIDLLEYAIKSNEVFIRNLCSYLFFLNVQKFSDSFLLDKILTDEYPSVVFHGLRGFFQGMPNNSKYLNKKLVERFDYFFKKDELFCIRASTLMSNFSTDYAGDCIDWREIPQDKKKWLWRVWGKFFKQFLKVFPTDVQFYHYPRFSGMMNEAAIQVYPNQGCDIAKQMLRRLKRISANRILDNHEMHLIDFLIVSTKSKPDLRKAVFNKFFVEKLPTYFVGYNILWSFSQWDNLLDDEKLVICETLKGDRKDLRWLRAIVLNNHIFPPESIQKTIFNDNKILTDSYSWIIKNIDVVLLFDIITVYFGHDSALQAVGASGSSKWVRDLIYQIAIDNEPIFYNECVDLFISHYINGVYREELDFYKTSWEKIYSNSSDKSSILKLVIKVVGTSSFCKVETAQLFEVIIKYHQIKKELEWLSYELIEDFEALYYYTNDREIFRALQVNDFVKKHLFPLMPTQVQILNLSLNLKDEPLTIKEKNEYVNEMVRLSTDAKNGHSIPLKTD